MNRNTILSVAGILGALAVAAGAFGAHGLESRVTPERLDVFETGVRYHAWHTLALLGLAALPAGTRRIGLAAWLFMAGIIVFSGSLYVLVLTDTGWLGAVTPIGGIAMIAGWVALATARFPRGSEQPGPGSELVSAPSHSGP